MKVQIDQELLADLYKYHLGGIHDLDISERICAGLKKKLNSQVRRQSYSQQLKQHRSDDH